MLPERLAYILNNMDNAAEVLLIIVSATLSVFLVVAIIAGIKIIQILGDLRRISAKAEQVIDKAEAVGEFFQKTAAPAALVKLVSNVVHMFKDDKAGKEE